MKYLVTGCLGFIGSHFVNHMAWFDVQIVGVSRNTDQKNLNRLRSQNNVKLVFQDLNDPNICELLEDVDVVVNFAAKTFVDYSVRDPKPFMDSNVLGTYNLLEAWRKNQHVKLFVQVSTDEVYGPLPDPDNNLMTCEALAARNGWSEGDPLNPTNPYSATKAAADLLCMGYAKTYCMPLLITRTENNYGYFQHPQKVIPNWTRRALAGEKLPVYGDGKHKRMWLRVEDHAEAIRFLIEKQARGIYHIAGGQELENIELAKVVLDTLGKDSDAIEFIDDSKIRPNHDRRYGLDTTKIRELGWSPRFEMRRGIRDAVQWYANNQWWMI